MAPGHRPRDLSPLQNSDLPGGILHTINREHGFHPARESGKEALCRPQVSLPPWRGSRREGEARLRAGGGPTRRPAGETPQRIGGAGAVPPTASAFAFNLAGACPRRRHKISPVARLVRPPHRIGLRHSARPLRLPLKGGVILAFLEGVWENWGADATSRGSQLFPVIVPAGEEFCERLTY